MKFEATDSSGGSFSGLRCNVWLNYFEGIADFYFLVLWFGKPVSEIGAESDTLSQSERA